MTTWIQRLLKLDPDSRVAKLVRTAELWKESHTASSQLSEEHSGIKQMIGLLQKLTFSDREATSEILLADGGGLIENRVYISLTLEAARLLYACEQWEKEPHNLICHNDHVEARWGDGYLSSSYYSFYRISRDKYIHHHYRMYP